MQEWILALSIFTHVAVLILLHDSSAREKDQIEREEQLKQWLFKSLYTISPRVVLPEKYEVEESEHKFASVYNPQEDPKNIWNGKRSDL